MASVSTPSRKRKKDNLTLDTQAEPDTQRTPLSKSVAAGRNIKSPWWNAFLESPIIKNGPTTSSPTRSSRFSPMNRSPRASPSLKLNSPSLRSLSRSSILASSPTSRLWENVAVGSPSRHPRESDRALAAEHLLTASLASSVSPRNSGLSDLLNTAAESSSSSSALSLQSPPSERKRISTFTFLRNSATPGQVGMAPIVPDSPSSGSSASRFAHPARRETGNPTVSSFVLRSPSSASASNAASKPSFVQRLVFAADQKPSRSLASKHEELRRGARSPDEEVNLNASLPLSPHSQNAATLLEDVSIQGVGLLAPSFSSSLVSSSSASGDTDLAHVDVAAAHNLLSIDATHRLTRGGLNGVPSPMTLLSTLPGAGRESSSESESESESGSGSETDDDDGENQRYRPSSGHSPATAPPPSFTGSDAAPSKLSGSAVMADIEGKTSIRAPKRRSSAKNDHKPCNCKKSRCLKLYCECFARQGYCKDCNCQGCCNTPDHEDVRQKAIAATLDRDSHAFFRSKSGSPRQEVVPNPIVPGKGLPVQHPKGCHCKKSMCLKKYCECYQAGIPCSDICKCVDCRNPGGLHSHIGASPKGRKKAKPKAAGAPSAAATPSGTPVAAGPKKAGTSHNTTPTKAADKAVFATPTSYARVPATSTTTSCSAHSTPVPLNGMTTRRTGQSPQSSGSPPTNDHPTKRRRTHPPQLMTPIAAASS